MPDKYAAFGAKLQYLVSTTWTDIGGMRDLGGPGTTGETTDVTCHSSPGRARQFVKTLIDNGEISFDLVFDPEDTGGQADLEAQSVLPTAKDYRVVFNTANAKTWQMSCYVTNFETNQPVEGEISASVTLKVNGVIDKNPV